MSPQSELTMQSLLDKLKTVAVLDAEDEQLLRMLPAVPRFYEAGADIAREDDEPSACVLIGRGWACRYKTTEDGLRQIVSIHFAGDIPDLQSLLLVKMDHSLAALSALEVLHIPHAALSAACLARPNLARAFWRYSLIDGSIYRQWLLAMGRLQAPQHLGHLICETHARLAAVGLAGPEGQMDVPITQVELADVLGMSVVHVNRTVQDLRSRGLISWGRGRMTVKDLAGLTEFAGFDPAYLHMTA